MTISESVTMPKIGKRLSAAAAPAYPCILLLALMACAAPPLPPQSPLPVSQATLAWPAQLPAAWYRAAAARGETVLHIDAAASLVEIEVRRGGTMARLGHDHIIASRNVRGLVAPQTGRADLYVALDSLIVDEPALRKVAGLLTEPSPEAIAGTRRNMLDKVLETERFPFAYIHVQQLEDSLLQVELTLHGVTRSWNIPAQLKKTAHGIVVSGKLQLLQSEFGITPFSVLGGALQVQDGLTLRFNLYAAPL
jgi:hypothetical protein